MNKDLYHRKAKLPESLKNHLQKSFEMVEGDSNTEGYNRNKELRETGIMGYPVLKRVKNWFDSYQGDGKDAPYILNGGDRMHKWCNHVLDHWRGSLEQGKKIKHDTGMENQYIDNHEKDGIVVNPHDKHEKGINKLMATQNDKLDFYQPNNQLSAIAEAERGKLFPKNDFSPKSDKYSAVHPDAVADGDEIGRGTGTFLDVYNQNAGTSTDVFERKDDIKINKYNSSKPYTVE